MLRSLFVTALILSIGSVPGCASTVGLVEPIAQDDPLPTGTPEAVGLDLSYLSRIARHLSEEADHEIHSILVVRNGLLVFERYYHGFGPDHPHDLRSATKSITALLTGIAIERGAVAGVDAPLMDYLARAYPGVRDKDDILLHHLLTMSSGLDCDDGDRSTRGQEDRMYRSRDWVGYFLSLSRPYAPGDVTRYCTGGVVALGAALAEGTGQDVAVFAEDALFEPLGIRNYRWARFDRGRKVDTGGHLLLTPKALAKVGLLVLGEGRWGAQQVVPAEWIARAVRPWTQIQGEPYGYLWWRTTLRYGSEAVDVISARGNGGQVLFVVPEHDLVAVFTGGYYNSDEVQVIYSIFYNAVMTALPAFRAYTPDGP
ncbi:MAG: serine hydrolase [Rhodothermales bacterium]|nr:serine hydrolase [Rhodothermales bacterium]